MKRVGALVLSAALGAAALVGAQSLKPTPSTSVRAINFASDGSATIVYIVPKADGGARRETIECAAASAGDLCKAVFSLRESAIASSPVIKK